MTHGIRAHVAYALTLVSLLSIAACTIQQRGTGKEIMTIGPSGISTPTSTGGGGMIGGSAGAASPDVAGIFFTEDFSGYEVLSGAQDWGPNAIIAKSPIPSTRAQFLTTKTPGRQTVQRRLPFPADWTLRFDFSAPGWKKIDLLLLDPDGGPVKISLSVSRDYKGYELRSSMTNSVESKTEWEYRSKEPALHHLRVDRKGSTVKLFWNDQPISAVNYPSLGNVTGFKLEFEPDVYFTNFVGAERSL